MSEETFLQQLFQRLPAAPAELNIGPGDDCAALDLGNSLLQLLTVDQVIADVHYFAAGGNPTPPELAGRKLLARNLSDIAAMGGTPRYALLACAISHEHDETWLLRFCDGILRLAAEFNVHLVGGDLARLPAQAETAVFSLTLSGEVAASQVCRRHGAAPGDLLFATGSFGSSLETGQHLLFQPRCAEGRWLARNGFAKAMIDVSDGLCLDAGRLAAAAGIGVEINAAEVPLRTPQTAFADAAGDGEDYELLFALAPANAARLTTEWPFPEVRLTCIGSFSSSFTGVRVPGRPDIPIADAGYDHLNRGREC